MDTSKIHRYIWRGRHDLNWYRECEDLIVDRYGIEDKRLVAQLLAATSINSSMKSNITLFRKAYAWMKNPMKLDFPKVLPNIGDQIMNVAAGRELSGRKINAFANAMSGDTQAVVVDVWLLRAFSMDKQYKRHTGPHMNRERSGGPTNKQYTDIEAWVRQEAMYMGVEPRQLSAMIWSGMRTITNGPDKTHYKQVLVEASMELFPKTKHNENRSRVNSPGEARSN